jgi:hypothetical protein
LSYKVPFISENTQPMRVVTTGTSVTATDADGIIVINLETPAAFTVTLPTSPLLGKTIAVVDGAGNAFTYPITVESSANINGSSTYTIDSNYNAAVFAFNGTSWNVLHRFTNGAYGI